MYNQSAPAMERSTEVKRVMVKDRSRASMLVEEDYIFNDYQCDICGENPRNFRYHCLGCEDYDICADCYNNRSEEHRHREY
jgi:hypothetical protein